MARAAVQRRADVAAAVGALAAARDAVGGAQSRLGCQITKPSTDRRLLRYCGRCLWPRPGRPTRGLRSCPEPPPPARGVEASLRSRTRPRSVPGTGPRLPSRGRLGHASLPIARLEEARDRARRAGDDDHRPDLQDDVDDAAGRRERVRDLRRDGEQLHRGEEERIEEGVDVALLRMPLEQVDRDGADERRPPQCKTSTSRQAGDEDAGAAPPMT